MRGIDSTVARSECVQHLISIQISSEGSVLVFRCVGQICHVSELPFGLSDCLSVSRFVSLSVCQSVSGNAGMAMMYPLLCVYDHAV